MAEVKTLPPPPSVRRFDELGRPTKAQIEYDLRLDANVGIDKNTKQRIDTLEAQSADNLARIIREETVRADADTAFGHLIVAVEAAVADNSVKITDETTARIKGDDALASRVVTVEAGVADASAKITSETTARVTGDVALGTRIDNLVVSSGNNAAVIIDTEAKARADADSALGQRIDTVVATAAGNTAAITTEQTVRANADTALGVRVDTVSAVAGQQRVFLQSAQPTGKIVGDLWLNSADGNKAKYWNGTAWVDATYDVMPTVSAAISTETTARTTADTALGQRIDAVLTRVGNNEAAITQEATARASADQALSQQITTVEANVTNNITGKLTQTQQAVADINGNLATKWAIEGNINGVTGGLTFTGVKKADNSGPVYNLEINAGVTINGGLIVRNSITADKLSANSLSAINADLGTVTAGVMRSTDGKFIIDLTNKSITISD